METYVQQLKRRGFTLIEMVVAIVIIGLLAGMAVPSLSSAAGTVAKSGANMIAHDMEFARSEANLRVETVTMSFSADDESYSILDSSGSVLTSALNGRELTVSLMEALDDQQVDIQSASFGSGASFDFTSLGEPVQTGTSQPVAEGACVLVGSGDVTYSVTVTPIIGRIQVNRLD